MVAARVFAGLLVLTSLYACDRPSNFYPTPNVGQHGWVSTDGSEGDIDWEVVEMIVGATYRRVAPKRLVAQLDEQP